MDTITFETYPDMFTDYEKHIENEEYDDTIREFTVPKGWAIDWVFINYRMGLDEFLEEYTWDDTYKMYQDAVMDQLVQSESIESR